MPRKPPISPFLIELGGIVPWPGELSPYGKRRTCCQRSPPPDPWRCPATSKTYPTFQPRPLMDVDGIWRGLTINSHEQILGALRVRRTCDTGLKFRPLRAMRPRDALEGTGLASQALFFLSSKNQGRMRGTSNNASERSGAIPSMVRDATRNRARLRRGARVTEYQPPCTNARPNDPGSEI